MPTAPATTNLATDERAPLLVPPPALTADASIRSHDPEAGADPALAAHEAPPAPRAPWTPWTIFWTALVWGAGLVGLVLLIKGFIEADDVEVRSV